ncbi:MAG: group II intron maturase-specific domain-containing protein [Rhizonema sp. NSF051]|nr:group II intron maturase-specific domain-containing protein [Rhizonema sp. NSF051]
MPTARVSQYQAEYRGLVQYYRMAYNLHTLSSLKRVMELSLVKTLAKKFKTTCQKIYKRYRTTIDTKDGTYKVLLVIVQRVESVCLVVSMFRIDVVKL